MTDSHGGWWEGWAICFLAYFEGGAIFFNALFLPKKNSEKVTVVNVTHN